MTIAAGCLFFLESNQSSSLGKLHAGDIIKAELKVPVYCHFSKIFVFPTVLSLFLNQNCKSSLFWHSGVHSHAVFVSELKLQIFTVVFWHLGVHYYDWWMLAFCFQMICPMEERLAIIFYFNQQPLTIRVCSIFCCSCKTCLTPSCLWRGTRS